MVLNISVCWLVNLVEFLYQVYRQFIKKLQSVVADQILKQDICTECLSVDQVVV